MTSWQRHARLGVLLFGTVTGAVVYFGVRERQPLASYGPAPQLEPKAVSECQEGSVQQVSGAREDAVISYSRCVTYEDGTTKLFDVRVVTRNRDGRDFTVAAKEGQVKGKSGYELAGGVFLRDSTGFELRTDACQFDGTIVTAAGPVTFTKGRMSGGGVGMSYDLSLDLLHIQQGAQIDVSGDKGSMHSTAGSAMLDRRQDLLTLERDVQAIRDSQVTAADRAVARLSADEDVITFVELRGNARVDGETGAVKSMHARDIDLDYTDDGAAIERALLIGQGAITLSGSGGGPGRQATAETFDIALAADGSLSKLVANGTVVMTLPASSKGPGRSVSSDTLEGSGGTEGSLTRSRFSGNVVFREGAGASEGMRVARARALTLAMSDDDAISSALFSGGATFEEDDLRASAAEARYEPEASRLQLSGSEGGALPSVADHRLRVEAQAVDLGLERRTMDARGKVKTFLTPATGPAKPERSPKEQASRLPGLFAQDQVAHVTSSRLVHDGEGGVAHFSGAVWLSQGEREIRADGIDINQTTGDLIATGSASSNLVFESGRWEGKAPEIRYTDATRVITYTAIAPPQKPGTTVSRLKGPQTDLAGRRIEVILAQGENRVDRIEAYDSVTALVDGKTITGQHVTYRAQDDRYEVEGTPRTPVIMRESCREMVGMKLTFDRSTDTMTVDGRTIRTETKNPCRTPASPR